MAEGRRVRGAAARAPPPPRRAKRKATVLPLSQSRGIGGAVTRGAPSAPYGAEERQGDAEVARGTPPAAPDVHQERDGVQLQELQGLD